MNFIKERNIRKALRQLSRQRVVTVLQPGNVWVIEKSPKDNEETENALKTCYLRGWVEPIDNAIPQGRLTRDNKLPPDNWIDKIGPMYRVTEGGWAVINRTHQWSLLVVFLTILAIILQIPH